MAQRTSEQIIEYLTAGGDNFTPQTNVPLHVQGHTILGSTTRTNNNDDYTANLTTINGHLIINPYYNTHNNYSYGIRINEGSNGKALLMLGGANNSTEGVNDKTWYIGSYKPSSSSTITDLTIARAGSAFSLTSPSMSLTNNGLNIYKAANIKAEGNNVGVFISGRSENGTETAEQYGYFKIERLGTTSTEEPGLFTLRLGNDISSGTIHNACGVIRIYSEKNGRATILTKPDATNSSDAKHYLPTLGNNTENWLVVGSTSGVGSTSTPVYIKNTGEANTVSNSTLINLSSTSAANIYVASPRPGVTGTLAVGNGGTGKTQFDANRLLYASGSTTIASLSNIYVNSGKMAINETSAPASGYCFEVSGKSNFLDDVNIAGQTFLGDKLKTYDAISHIIDSNSEEHIYTPVPQQVISTWNTSADSKYLEISLPSGISQVAIGFWVDFYSSAGIGSFCIYGEIPSSNEAWQKCQVYSLGYVTITQFPVQFCRDNNKYKIIIGNGQNNIINSYENRNFIIRDIVTYNMNYPSQDLFNDLSLTSQLLSNLSSNIITDTIYYDTSIGDTPDYIYRLKIIKGQANIFNRGSWYYFNLNGNDQFGATAPGDDHWSTDLNSHGKYTYETFGTLQRVSYLVKFKIIYTTRDGFQKTTKASHIFNFSNTNTAQNYYLSEFYNSEYQVYMSLDANGFNTFRSSDTPPFSLKPGDMLEVSCLAM